MNENDVMSTVEDLVESCWPIKSCIPKPPFRRMKFNDVLNQYGSDKPDVRFDLKINDLTETFKQHVSSGSNRIDSVRSQNTKDFSVLGIRIPASLALIDSNEIEKEYKSIFGVTYFNPQIHSASKDTFTLLTMKNNSAGNHIVKHVRNEVKSDLRQKLDCQNDLDQIIVLVSANRAKSLEILGKLRLAIADLIDSKIKVIIRVKIEIL